MKAKELAEELLKHPDFDVEFATLENITDEESGIKDFPYLFRFNNVKLGVIVYPDKLILLTGEEYE